MNGGDKVTLLGVATAEQHVDTYVPAAHRHGGEEGGLLHVMRGLRGGRAWY